MRVGKGAVPGVAVLALVTGCAGGDLPFVGLDRDGRGFERFLRGDRYQEQALEVLEELQTQALPVLDRADGGRSDRDWQLRRVMIGVGAAGTVGVGEFVKLGGTIGFRLILSNVAPARALAGEGGAP